MNAGEGLVDLAAVLEGASIRRLARLHVLDERGEVEIQPRHHGPGVLALCGPGV